MRSVHLDGENVPLPPDKLDLSAGGEFQLTVTISTVGATIGGSVVDSGIAYRGGALVVLKPESVDGGTGGVRLTTTDQNGDFRFYGVPPGRFRMLAWDEPEPGDYLNPVLLQKWRDRSVDLEIHASEQLRQDLAVIFASK